MNSGYGQALANMVAQQVPAFGRIFIVVNSSDVADENYNRLQECFPSDPRGVVRFFTSIESAYAAMGSNNDDVCLLAAHTSHKTAAMLTIAKNRIHFFGMDGGDRQENQRTLISNTGAGAATDTAMVKVTGTGVTFRNVSFKNNWTVANNLYSVDDQSAFSMFTNCSFQNLGSAHLTNNAAASLRISSQDTEYWHCSFGQDTLKVTSVGGQQVLIKKETTAATRVRLYDPLFRSYTSDTTHVFLRVSADDDIDRSVTLINPVMNNFNFDASNGGAQLAVAVATPNALVSGGLHIINPAFNFATKLATNAVGNAGVYVSANTQPTAAGVAAIKATT